MIFEQEAVDVAILEVGLGGRLDAVNIVDADCALITSIGIDHVEFLGEPLPWIEIIEPVVAERVLFDRFAVGEFLSNDRIETGAGHSDVAVDDVGCADAVVRQVILDDGAVDNLG